MVDCGYSLSLAVILKCQSGFVEGNVAWCFSKECVVVLDLSLSLFCTDARILHIIISRILSLLRIFSVSEWRIQSFTIHGKRTYIMRSLNSVFEFVHPCANRHSERLRNRSDR